MLPSSTTHRPGWEQEQRAGPETQSEQASAAVAVEKVEQERGNKTEAEVIQVTASQEGESWHSSGVAMPKVMSRKKSWCQEVLATRQVGKVGVVVAA